MHEARHACPGETDSAIPPSLCGGGAERVLVNLAHGMVEKDIRVDVVLGRATGPFLPHLPGSARVVDLRASRIACSVLPLARYLRKARPDALLAFQDHTSVAAIVAAGIARSPTHVFAAVHSNWRKVLEGADHKQRMLAWIATFAYRYATSVITVSQGAAAAVVSCLGIDRRQVQVIYNPVVTSDLFSRADDRVLHPWFEAGHLPVILAVGRLDSAKDFVTLITSFGRLRKRCPAHLLILGEGGERPALEALVKELGLSEDVALPGFVANPYPYLRQASVFVLSSAWEGLPTVLIEALALGTPIVSTDCESGPSEILDHGRYGALVAVGDVDAMADAMYKAITVKHSKPDNASWASFTVPTATAAYIDTLFRPYSPNLSH